MTKQAIRPGIEEGGDRVVAAGELAREDLVAGEEEGAAERQQRPPGEGVAAGPDDEQHAGEAARQGEPGARADALAEQRAAGERDDDRGEEDDARHLRDLHVVAAPRTNTTLLTTSIRPRRSCTPGEEVRTRRRPMRGRKIATITSVCST